MATVNTLTTIYSSHQIYLERLSAQYSNQLDSNIEAINKRVGAVVAALPNRQLTADEQKAVRAEIDLIVKEELRDWTSALKGEHRELGYSEAVFMDNAVQGVIISDVATTIPAVSQINSKALATPIKIGEGKYTTYNSMLSYFVSDNANSVDMIIRNGFASTATRAQVTAQIVTELDLLTSRAKTSAKQISRTGTNHYATQSRLKYQENNDDIIIGWRSVGTLDSRTSKQCGYYDGKVRKEGDSDWSAFQTPRHPNCRSSLSPEIDGRYKYDDSSSQRPTNFEVDGEKDPGRVNSKKTYYDELSKLKAKDQDIALGSPTLGKAFRKMERKGDRAQFERQVLDSLYQPLSITEMKAANNELGRILRDMAS